MCARIPLIPYISTPSMSLVMQVLSDSLEQDDVSSGLTRTSSFPSSGVQGWMIVIRWVFIRVSRRYEHKGLKSVRGRARTSSFKARTVTRAVK